MAVIDLRSDTVTKPTPAMLQAVVNANFGDDVLGDDSDTRTLEERAAALVGMEAAIFMPSGTMANLIATLCHTKPGDAIAMEQFAHTYMLEVGGMAAIAGTMSVRIPGAHGVYSPQALEQAFYAPFREEVPITLVWLENTHNLAGGTVTTPAQTKAIAEVAHRHGAKVHIDGARLFNAVIAQGIDVNDLTRDADSVMFSLSKGLSCPGGSLLCGTRELIVHARHLRWRHGGSMRQSCVLAACGLVALEQMIGRLADDHANAKLLAERLKDLPGIDIDLPTVQTNMVYFRVTAKTVTAPELVARCAERGVKFFNLGPDRIRLVTHKDVTREECERAAEVVTGEIERN